MRSAAILPLFIAGVNANVITDTIEYYENELSDGCKTALEDTTLLLNAASVVGFFEDGGNVADACNQDSDSSAYNIIVNKFNELTGSGGACADSQNIAEIENVMYGVLGAVCLKTTNDASKYCVNEASTEINGLIDILSDDDINIAEAFANVTKSTLDSVCDNGCLDGWVQKYNLAFPNASVPANTASSACSKNVDDYCALSDLTLPALTATDAEFEAFYCAACTGKVSEFFGFSAAASYLCVPKDATDKCFQSTYSALSSYQLQPETIPVDCSSLESLVTTAGCCFEALDTALSQSMATNPLDALFTTCTDVSRPDGCFSDTVSFELKYGNLKLKNNNDAGKAAFIADIVDAFTKANPGVASKIECDASSVTTVDDVTSLTCTLTGKEENLNAAKENVEENGIPVGGSNNVEAIDPLAPILTQPQQTQTNAPTTAAPTDNNPEDDDSGSISALFSLVTVWFAVFTALF